MESTIFEFRAPEKEGKCKARVSVTFETPFGELTISGFAVFKGDGEDPWVSYPSTPYEKEGEKRWYTFVELPRVARRRFEAQLVKEYRAWLEREGVPF